MHQHLKMTQIFHKLHTIVILCQFKRSLSQDVTFIAIEIISNEILITISSYFGFLFPLLNKKLTYYLKINLTFSLIAYRTYSRYISD